MEKQETLEMIQALDLDEQINYENIPDLDLYMDQVITLFENTLSHTKRYENDKLLTKTMINNYIKDKLLMPAVKKKYTREHVVLMILLYELKQILTISDIKEIFGVIIRDGQVDKEVLKQVYEMYLQAKSVNTASFTDEAEKINSYLTQEMEKEGMTSNENLDQEKLISMMEVILLTQKAEYYKRLAEKIIDEKIKKAD